MNDKDYFRSIVLRGKNFTKMVRKNSKTLEGRKVTRDVIETYVPIFGRDKVVGAFEIYYDITGAEGKVQQSHPSINRHHIRCFLYSGDIAAGQSVYSVQEYLRPSSGGRSCCQARTRNWRKWSSKGPPRSLAANLRIQEDIRKRQAVEQDLLVSEERYRSLVEMAGDAIFIADAETGIIIDVNRKATELVGRQPSRLSAGISCALHPADDGELYRRLVGITIQRHPAQQNPLRAAQQRP